jgi:glycosyl transferase family 92
MKTYLSACAMYRDHAGYLVEWIEFHRLVGFERLFLYNNLSTDEHREILDPYIKDGTVVLQDWPHQYVRTDGRPHGLLLAYDHCLETRGAQTRWIAFLDIDEFLFSPSGELVSEALREYERWPALVVSRAEFGTSGHRTRPPGFVIENYLQRSRYRPDSIAPIKSVVDPNRAIRAASIHHFHLKGVAVNEKKQPFTGGSGRRTWVSFERLRINHYRTKSEEELRQKLELWESIGYARPQHSGPGAVERPGELDETITQYVPVLRDAVNRAAGDA